MNKLFVKSQHLKMLTDIFNTYCPQAEIWAYGSRVNGDAHEGSDLDLVVKSFNADNKHVWHLKEMFSESDIPFLIDIVEYDSVPESFQKEIEKNYVVIYG